MTDHSTMTSRLRAAADDLPFSRAAALLREAADRIDALEAGAGSAPQQIALFDQREVDIATSEDVQRAEVHTLVLKAGALLHPGRTDLTEIAGRALISEFRHLEDEDLVHDDLEEAGLPEMIEDLEALLTVDWPEGGA